MGWGGVPPRRGSPPMPLVVSNRRRLAPLAGVAACVLALAGAALAGGSSAAQARPSAAAAAALRITTLAPGVTFRHDSFRNNRGRTVEAVLLQARLGRHVTLQARTPQQLIGR